MRFHPSSETESFIESVHARVGARNKAVLGRAGLFLALGQGVPKEYEPKNQQGKELNDETVVGDDLRDIVQATLNYRAGYTLDESSYKREFRRHFEYGCMLLQQIWEESSNDQTLFVTKILDLIGDDIEITRKTKEGIKSMPIVNHPVELKLFQSSEPWIINDPGQNGLLVISGKPGTGKSQLALDLLAQVANQGLRFVFFDLKGELENDPTNSQQKENRNNFFKITNAKYIRLIQQDLPINPLIYSPNPSANAQISYEIASLIRAYAHQLGAKQERTIADAYQRINPPDFIRLLDELESNGATGVEYSIIKKIVDLNLFASSFTSASHEEFFKDSLVIDFKDFGNDNDTKSLVVALILNFLMNKFNQNLPITNNVQPLKMILFVDEAHHLLPKEGKAGLLGKLARQGRSWGFPVWLASQDADAFVTSGNNATNFAELATCGIHFSPETLSERQQKQIIGKALHQKLQFGEASLRLKNDVSLGKVRQFWRDMGNPS